MKSRLAGFSVLVALASCGGTGSAVDLDADVPSERPDANASDANASDATVDATSVADADADADVDAAVEENGEDAATPSPCRAPVPDSNELAWELDVDGRTRSARVVLPDGYSDERRWPLVLSIHALGSNAALQESYTRMSEQTRSRGFVIVYPEGTGASWNAGTCCGTAAGRVDDVAFLAAVVDRAERELCIDAERIHATGMSNGGYMTHRLGCELADRLASIAPVAGADATTDCTPARPLPVHLHHGTLDTVVPFVAGIGARDAWRERNGCGDAEGETFFEGGGTTCERWRCDAVVELCRSTVGHVWPGGVASPAGIEATDAVLDFFEAHPRR
jgi:polyhydroxybutyrate depolymerase